VSPSSLPAFLDAAGQATDLLGRPELSAHWEDDSALALFTVSALAGHLLRGMTVVEQYLEGPVPDGEPVSASAYFHILGVSGDVTAPANEAIRTRGAQTAAGGPTVVAAEAASARARLQTLLEAIDPARRMGVAGGLVITLDAYLRTRIVELVVHTDDLATSVGLATPAVTAEAAGIAIDTLVGVARLRHGDGAVLRALTRRERDAVSALRVL
jgi:hypothetical protein